MTEYENLPAEKRAAATLADRLPAALKTYPVVSAYLFGSYASGNIHPGSDIDVALYTKPGSKLSLDELLTLGREIERQTGLKPVDVRIINDMPLTVKGEILTKGVLLYSGDNARRVAFETKTLAEYFDYLPHIERMRESFLRSVEKRGIL